MHKHSIITQLLNQLPEQCVLFDAEDLRPYECDGLSAYHRLPLAVVIPESVEQARTTLQLCAAEGVPVVARGAGTGLSGGALPHAEGILLSMSRFNRILDIDYAQGHGNSVDTQLHLFEGNGDLLTYNDDSSTSAGGGGSMHGYDSYLEYDIRTDGYYYAAVTSYNNDGSDGGAFDDFGYSTGDYILHASIESQLLNDTMGSVQIVSREDFGYDDNADDIRITKVLKSAWTQNAWRS